MPKMLKSGETRTIRANGEWVSKKKTRFEVEAICVDSDTPFVRIRFYDLDGGHEYDRTLEDTYASELVRQIQAALAVLPTSK